MVCCRAGDETGGYGFQERREREVKLSIYFCDLLASGRVCWQVPRECLLELGDGITGCTGMKDGEDLSDLLEVGTERREGCHKGCRVGDDVGLGVGRIGFGGGRRVKV